jgi:hypothetical protein
MSVHRKMEENRGEEEKGMKMSKEKDHNIRRDEEVRGER